MKTKTCARCGVTKTCNDFHRRSRSPDGLHSWCKNCSYLYNRERLQDPRKRSDLLAWRKKYDKPSRESRVLYLYGITVTDIEALLVRQGGGCAICSTPEPGGRWNTWHVDHDHGCCPRGRKTCGKCVRGLLCQNCNLLLGHAKNDPEVLQKASVYLEKFVETKI